MIVIDIHDLERVTGGAENGQRVNVPGASAEQRRSDYGYCVDNVRQQMSQKYPNNGGWFGTDTNAGPRAQRRSIVEQHLHGNVC